MGSRTAGGAVASKTGRAGLLLCSLLFFVTSIVGQSTQRCEPNDNFQQATATFYTRGDTDKHAWQTVSKRMQVIHSGTIEWRIQSRALYRTDPGACAGDRIRYFAGRRYLPPGSIIAVSPGAAADIWVRTRAGSSHITFVPMSLARKADILQQRLRQRHARYGLIAPSLLQSPGILGTSHPWPSDNDGLWTAIYAAAECYRFATTHASDALANARESLTALIFLEHVTGRAGLPARSYVRKGEPHPADGIWRDSPTGCCFWKGDTSSDEIVGHMFAYAIAWDLLPRDDRTRGRIRSTVARIADHIITHGYELTDVDGRPTTWGKWSPRYFATREGRSDSPLNALELLSILKTALHVTSEPRFAAEYDKVAHRLGYAALTARELALRDEINYSDEELAMLSFYAPLRYERDAALIQIYRVALEQWWRNIEREKNPAWISIRAFARPATPAEIAGGTWTLRRYPLDLVDWRVTNSQRPDLRRDPQPDRFGHAQARDVLPPDERPVMKWNANPFQLDGGNGGRSEDDGAAWLLAYWIGRSEGLWQ